MDNFIKMTINPEMLQVAKTRAIKTIEMANENGLTPKFQTDELDNKTTGFLGEIIFKTWLDQQGINYLHSIVYGRADEADFIIDDKKYGVKTGNMQWDVENLQPGYKFFIPEQQANYPMDFYVNIQLDNKREFGYITGFIANEKTKAYPINQSEKMTNPARCVPLGALTPMNEFKTLRRLKNG